MLEKIREGAQGVWASVILGLVILSFVFAGVGSYITSSGEPAAAKVNGEEIPLSVLDRAYQNERARMEQQFGEAFAALFSDEDYLRQFRQGVLDRLIAETLMEQQATEMGLRASDEQVKEAILAMPEFQIGGQFNNDRYLAILRQAGYQPNTFRDYLRAQMTREQLTRAIAASEFNLPQETKALFLLQSQTRDMQMVTVPAQPFEADVVVSEDELNTFYQANLSRYDTEEQVSLAYVELKVADLMADVEASDEEIQEYYQANINSYRTEEERRASHILIEFGDDESAAQAQAEAVLTRVQGGEDFAEVASVESADTFSAENGGDLDWFSRGVMDPAFEEAAFALENVGDVSTVVKSEFGFHVIKLTDVKPEQITPFVDVEGDIRQAVLTEKATEEFYVVQQAMAEVAFEMPDSLEETAAAANMPIQTTALFSRTTAPVPFNEVAALNAAFSEELVEEGVNSDVIEVADEHIVIMRVAEHQPQRTRSFDEVRDDINTALVAEKAQQAAADWAEALVQQLAEQSDIQPALDEKALQWQEHQAVTRNGGSVDFNVAEQVFKLVPAGGQDAAVVNLNSGDVALVQLKGVNPGTELADEQLPSVQQRLAATRSQAMYADIIESMRSRAEIEIFN